MILLAGVYDPDLERVKALLPHVAFPGEQLVIDRAFASGEITVPEWSKAIQALAAEQAEPFGFGTAISAGFFSGYLSLFPTAEIIVVRSDPVTAIQVDEPGFDRWAVARGVVMGQNQIEGPLKSVPHVLIDMLQGPTDAEIAGLLGKLERAA